MLAFSRRLRSVTFQYRYIQATGPTGLRSGFITSNGVDILMVMTNATCIAYPKESAQWRTVFTIFVCGLDILWRPPGTRVRFDFRAITKNLDRVIQSTSGLHRNH